MLLAAELTLTAALQTLSEAQLPVIVLKFAITAQFMLSVNSANVLLFGCQMLKGKNFMWRKADCL
jgi:hypothetical protein